jgi:quercetin dioxygenase-like cupin family protein
MDPIASDAPLPRPFRYQRPVVEKGKQIVRLGQTDRMICIVQVLKKGGETNLHSHPNMDGFWMVLSGRVRFYGEGNALIGDFGPMEGVLLPRGCPYWFENVEDETAELMQVEAFNVPLPHDDAIRADRINYTPPRRDMGSILDVDRV